MLTLTEKAELALERFAEGAPEPVGGLRITVVDGGCSGLQYAMSLEPGPGDGDDVVTCGATTVYVEATSIDLLRGTTIDFVESVQGSGFTFANPNATRSCACGKSFAAGC